MVMFRIINREYIGIPFIASSNRGYKQTVCETKNTISFLIIFPLIHRILVSLAFAALQVPGLELLNIVDVNELASFCGNSKSLILYKGYRILHAFIWGSKRVERGCTKLHLFAF